LLTDWPKGYQKVIIDEVDSTMKEARRRQADLIQSTWILAKNQTNLMVEEDELGVILMVIFLQH